MPSDRALQLAATAWCTETTSSKVMDPVLAEAFANILDSVMDKPASTMTIHQLTDESGEVIHACATASFPLPEDHWIYQDPTEIPQPLNDPSDELRSKLRNALKYTIQVCTQHGQDPDFDPDAMLATFEHQLFGYVALKPDSAKEIIDRIMSQSK